MFFFVKNSLIGLLATTTLVQGYANPGSCSGACWAHDPSVIQRTNDNLYFKFNTGGKIEIVTATSLSGPWTIKGYVLPSGSSIQLTGNQDLWAPDVVKVGSLYHLYYTVSTFGNQNSAIGLATSPSMDPGTWTDLGSTGVASDPTKNYNAIDAAVIQAGGKWYMNFSSFWDGIFQVALDSAAKKSSGTPYNIEYNSTGTRPSEGASMFYRSPYYYLLWSSGICCGYDQTKPPTGHEYKIFMCRSSSATGGFVDKNGKACTANGGSLLLDSHGTTYGPGGQGVFTDTVNGLVLYYHYAKTTVGLGDGQYLFGWNKLSWSNDWPLI